MKHIHQIGLLSVSDMTPAKLRVMRSITIDAPPQQVWSAMVDENLWPQWLPSVKAVTSVDHTRSDANGVGVERTSVYGNDLHIKETIVHVEPEKVVAWIVHFPTMVKDHLVVFQLHPNGGTTQLEAYAWFTPIAFTGLMMRFGFYSAIMGSSLKKLRQICAP